MKGRTGVSEVVMDRKRLAIKDSERMLLPESYRDVKKQQFSTRTEGEGVMSLVWDTVI